MNKVIAGMIGDNTTVKHLKLDGLLMYSLELGDHWTKAFRKN